MSLVGPRPIVDAEVIRYGRYFHFYCAVRPGITGLWQVSGRNNTSYRRRVAIDTVYSRSKSLGGDLAIIGRTFPAVLMSKGSF
jgi:lipopolysaccharide/colanic/teichoic acid biosynthesis glycosyltransferase